MTKRELIAEMIIIVNDKVNHYQTDLSYDIDKIYTSSEVDFYWIVRESGTNIVDIPLTENGKTVYDYYKNGNNLYYHIYGSNDSYEIELIED